MSNAAYKSTEVDCIYSLEEGKRTDARFTDGKQKIFNLLETSNDYNLVRKYALWLVTQQRNDQPETEMLGLKVSLHKSSRRLY